MSRGAWIAVGGSLALSVALAIALVVAIAAGGEDSPSAGAAEMPPPGGVQTVEPSAEVRECLAEQGVEPPVPGVAPPTDLDPESLQRAFEACGVGATVAPFSQGSGGAD